MSVQRSISLEIALDNRRVRVGQLEDQAEHFRALAVSWLAMASAARFLAIAALPLGNGEAYYYSWSRFPSWSYYDHPPLVAWMVYATTWFGKSAAAVRVGPILCAAAFGFLFHRLAERLVRPRTAFFALVVVTALPVFLITSFVVNPEAPLAPLWVGFLLVVEGMRDRDEPWRPILAGALLGLAFLAKYTALLLVPAALLYFALSPQSRRWLTRPSLYLGGAVALLVAMPVIGWNIAHGWPSLMLHFVERNQAAAPVPGENPFNTLVGSASGGFASLPGRVLKVLVGQFLSYSPFLAPFLAIGMVQLVRRARRNDGDLFLAVFGWAAWLPLIAALVAVKDSEQHWTMVAMVPAAIAAGRFVDSHWEDWKGLRAYFGASVALSGLAFALVNLHAHTTAVVRLFPADHYDAHADVINEMVGWDEVRDGLLRAAEAVPGKVVLAGTHYAMCGRMMFEMDDHPAVYCPTARRTEFDFIDRRHPPADATVIALTNDVHEALPAELSDRACKRLETLGIERAGRTVATYYFHVCPPAEGSGVSAVRDTE